jgi:hypothetical protein
MLRGEPDERSGQIMESSLTFRQSTGPAPGRPMSQRVRSTRAARNRENETT